jgi:hypothetical protein
MGCAVACHYADYTELSTTEVSFRRSYMQNMRYRLVSSGSGSRGTVAVTSEIRLSNLAPVKQEYCLLLGDHGFVR